MKRVPILLVTAAVIFAGAAAAAPIGKGASIFAIQLSEGTADLVTPELGFGYIFATDRFESEMGVQAQYWRFMADDYAFNITAGIGFHSETDQPSPDSAAVGYGDFKYTQSSWQVRIGGDRMAQIGERFMAFAGPGIQVWSGKAKFEDVTPPSASIETESTMRIALHVRYGGVIRLGEGFSLIGHLGHYWGYASAEGRYR